MASSRCRRPRYLSSPKRLLVSRVPPPLRAADAGQLGAALLIQEQLAGALTFVCLDHRLSTAAELESLRVAL